MIRVWLPENNPIVIAGVTSWLTSHSDIRIATAFDDSSVDVVLAISSLVDEPFLLSVEEVVSRIGAAVVLVLDDMPDDVMDAAVRARVASLLPRATMDRDSLVSAVISAAQNRARGAMVDVETLFAELDEVRLMVRHHPMAVLDGRDVELLNLLGCGWSAHEIAVKQSLPHRTVINRIQAVVKRCGARNRCEAVAHAARLGLV